jgi:alkylation response protein AidB-like acyl-CoA dehydrogenase
LDGSSRPGDAAVAKISFAETYHAIASYGARLGATTASKANAPVSVAEARERLRDWWLWSRAYTISGGSTEIMRNILAKRELELPDATVPAKNAAPRS